MKVNKIKNFNLSKYVQKLKKSQSASYMIGQETGLGLKEVFHPGFDRTIKTPQEIQVSEFYAKMKEDHEYMSDNYKNLLLNLKQVDEKYSNTQGLDMRLKLAKQGIDQWKSFIELTAKNLPEEDFQIRDDIIIKLKEIWGRFKRRNKQTILAEEVLPFHHEFTKYYELDLPIHPKNLAMMLHPHWGYYCKFMKNEFSLEDILNFYQTEYVSSHFRNIGRDILGNRTSAYNYWKIVDRDLNGFLPYNEFLYLLESMAFDVTDRSLNKFEKEHSFALDNLSNELIKQQDQKNIFRFRLFEFLFMQRCAIY